MKDEKKKDALTDLVGEISNLPDTSNQSSNNGTVSTPTGERVNLGAYSEFDRAVKLFLENHQREKIILQQKIEVLEDMLRKEREKNAGKSTN